MGTKVGLWIDHARAVVVTIAGRSEELRQTISTVGKQLRRSGDSPLQGAYDAYQVPASDSRQKDLTGHLNVYYDAVVASLGAADAILIMGPGEAKSELKKRLEKRGLAGRIVGFETVDKMTSRQLAVKVRKYFAAP